MLKLHLLSLLFVFVKSDVADIFLLDKESKVFRLHNSLRNKVPPRGANRLSLKRACRPGSVRAEIFGKA